MVKNSRELSLLDLDLEAFWFHFSSLEKEWKFFIFTFHFSNFKTPLSLVPAVTTGWNILEKATRAKTELILIIAELDKEEAKKCPGRRRRQSVYYKNIQEKIEAASDVGLVDVEVIESTNNWKLDSVMFLSCLILIKPALIWEKRQKWQSHLDFKNSGFWFLFMEMCYHNHKRHPFWCKY